MSNDAIQVGDKVELTIDVSVGGLLTLHAGVTGEVRAIVGDCAVVKVGGLLGLTVDIELTALVKVG